MVFSLFHKQKLIVVCTVRAKTFIWVDIFLRHISITAIGYGNTLRSDYRVKQVIHKKRVFKILFHKITPFFNYITAVFFKTIFLFFFLQKQEKIPYIEKKCPLNAQLADVIMIARNKVAKNSRSEGRVV